MDFRLRRPDSPPITSHRARSCGLASRGESYSAPAPSWLAALLHCELRAQALQISEYRGHGEGPSTLAIL